MHELGILYFFQTMLLTLHHYPHTQQYLESRSNRQRDIGESQRELEHALLEVGNEQIK